MLDETSNYVNAKAMCMAADNLSLFVVPVVLVTATRVLFFNLLLLVVLAEDERHRRADASGIERTVSSGEQRWSSSSGGR